VERAFSHFLMIRQGEYSKNGFLTEIQSEIKFGTDYTKKNIGLEDGLYFDKVKMYLDIFGKKSVHIIFFEDLIQNTTAVMNEIMRFLNIDYSFNDYNFRIHNEFVGPKSKIISQTLKKHQNIKKFFQKSIPFSTRKKINKMLLSSKNKPKMNSTEQKFLIEFYSEC